MRFTCFVWCAVLLFTGAPSAVAKIIDQCTEDIAEAKSREAAKSKGGPENNQLTNSSAPARAGKTAFKHWVNNRGERSELAMAKTEIGGTYWYGWSMFLPADFDHTGSKTIVMQLASYPTPRNGKFPCNANGPFLHIDAEGRLVFHLQHAGDDRDMVCDHFTVAEDVQPLKGKWIDFVMHAKWTGDKDGFCKLWMKVHDNNYFQKMNYAGRTWWNDEDQGPYFKMGAYMGEPGWKGPSERTLYTDEYRLGDASSSFDEVAPGAAERKSEAGKGTVQYVLYSSSLNKCEIPIMVYLPPGYAAGDQRYPVVYNLHGAGGGSPARQWDRVRTTLVDAMDGTKVRPLIYVFTNGQGDTFYIDAADKSLQIESSIVQELIPFIDKQYRTIATRQGRAVDGFSMGGFGCLMLAVKHPDLFCAVASYGAALVSAERIGTGPGKRFASPEHFEQHSPWHWVEKNSEMIRRDLKVRLVCGDADSLYPTNVEFTKLLERLKIPFSWSSVPGVGHDTKGLYQRVGLESLKLMETAFQPPAAAPPPKPVAGVEVRQWSPHEIVLAAERDYANAYLDVDLIATFTGPGTQLSVRGFWDGGRTFRIRFTPPIKGHWTYTTQSSPGDAGLATAGGFEAAGPKNSSHGFLRRDERWPTSFVFDDGTRHFMWGTTHYNLLLNARAGDRWKEAIDGAVRYGMNKARLTLETRGRDAGIYPGSAPFLDEAGQRLDLTHWRTADRVVSHMNDVGFLADLILFWRKNEKEVSSELRSADHRYLRYAVARYAAYPNVLWCMVNEWNYSSVPREYWNELGQLVRADDPWGRDGAFLRAHSIHQQTRPDWNFTDQAWPSHAILQLGVRNRGASTRVGDEWANAGKLGERFSHGDDWGNHSIVRNWTGKYPIVNDEYGYIGEPKDDSEPSNGDGSSRALTRDKHRRAMWGIACGGGFAAAGDKNDYGNNDKPYFTANWRDTAEYGDIRHLIDFFTKREIEYWRMAPHNKLVAGERTYVLAEPGRQYVVYAATGGAPALEVSQGFYAAWRYDPRTGAATALPEITGPTKHSFSLPDRRDWVVHVTRRGPRWIAGPVLLDDALSGRTQGQATGGQFVAGGGWTPAAPRGRIVWELPRQLAAGRLELDIKNFDPPRQAKVAKSNFLGMWETLWKNGDDEGQPHRDQWGLRIGTNYPQLKLKIHTRDACRYEKNLAPLAGGFDPARTYRLTVEWADGRTTFALDGQPFLVWDSPAGDPLDALKFVHLGSDTQFDAGSPGTSVAGPVYSNLKVTALELSQ